MPRLHIAVSKRQGLREFGSQSLMSLVFGLDVSLTKQEMREKLVTCRGC